MLLKFKSMNQLGLVPILLLPIIIIEPYHPVLVLVLLLLFVLKLCMTSLLQIAAN